METTSIRISNKEVKGSMFMASKWQNVETEASAYWLYKFAQSRGGWHDFTKQEIDAFSKHDFWFNKLIPYGDIKEKKIYDIILVDCEERKLMDSEKPYEYNAYASKKVVYTLLSTTYSFTELFINECHRLLNVK